MIINHSLIKRTSSSIHPSSISISMDLGMSLKLLNWVQLFFSVNVLYGVPGWGCGISMIVTSEFRFVAMMTMETKFDRWCNKMSYFNNSKNNNDDNNNNKIIKTNHSIPSLRSPGARYNLC